MTCYHPLSGYRTTTGSISFKRQGSYIDKPMTVACGQCVGCRLERSRQWAIRCVHEASLYQDNCFITLTYDDKNLPDDRSLNVEHFQKFMKRLRKKYGEQIRFYHCGEYGEKLGRPHYHACIFNFNFPDLQLWREFNGQKIYRSPSLEKLWPFGFSTVGTVTFESAAYVARYVMKKQVGKNAKNYYERYDPNSGEVFTLKPEYNTMSRRPGIGKKWYDKFKSDVFPLDEIILKGKKMRPPRYYDKLYELDSVDDFNKIKLKRIKKAKKHLTNNTPERNMVKERIAIARLELLKRGLLN